MPLLFSDRYFSILISPRFLSFKAGLGFDNGEILFLKSYRVLRKMVKNEDFRAEDGQIGSGW